MILDPLLDIFRGKAITIPPLDGAFRPNTALEEAEALVSVPAPDNLLVQHGALLYSTGSELRRLDGGAGPLRFAAPVTAAAAAADGSLAIALESGRIEFQGVGKPALEGFSCPMALAFADPATLLVCEGSAHNPPSRWRHDLMQKRASGSLWRVSLASGERTCLARGLAFPYGLAVDGAGGRLVVAESWRHRLLAIPAAGGAPAIVLDKLPGYPARLSPRAGGGWLLALFAPRNRLIEMVLTEDAYRAAMLAEIEPDHWIAPSLSASRSFLEPLQSGAVRSMGVHKPWSPSRSYGLLAELDAGFRPVASQHSRANGTRHGITSAVEHAGRIVAAAKGGDIILGLR